MLSTRILDIVINRFLLWLSYELYLASLTSELHTSLDSLALILYIIKDDRVWIIHIYVYILSVHGHYELLNSEGKTDRRCILSKLLEKIIVTAALDNSITGSISISAEYDSCIIVVSVKHTEIKAYVILISVALKSCIHSSEPLHSLKWCLIWHISLSLVKHGYSAEQRIKCNKCFLKRVTYIKCIHILLKSEKVLDMDVLFYLILLVLTDTRFSNQALEVVYLAYLYLEITDPDLVEAVYHSCDYLSVSSGWIIIYKLGTDLCDLLEFSLKLECVCIGIACIAESDRKFLICIILCNTSRYWRCYIRPEHQSIVVPVKELVHLIGRCWTLISVKYIKKLKCRCLYIVIAV